ncbi:MAG: YcaO-like family protein [Legionellales bacterium]|nr:YcaO-like family protein [Legionellales bacterium]
MKVVALPFLAIPLQQGVLIQYGELKLVIKGQNSFEIVERIKHLAAFPIEESHITEQLNQCNFNDNNADDVKTILKDLLANNLLIQINDITTFETKDTPESVFYWHLKLTEKEAQEKLVTANIIILGINVGSLQLEKHLKQLGFANVYCVSDDALNMRPIKKNYLYTKSSLETKKLLLAADYIIAYSLFNLVEPLLYWNDFCLIQKKKFLPITINNSHSYIGPLLLSNSVSCFRCAVSRELSGLNDRYLDSMKNYHQNEVSSNQGYHVGVISQTNIIAGNILLNHILCPTSLKLDTLIESRFLGCYIKEHLIHKVPLCHACEKNSPVVTKEKTLTLAKRDKIKNLLDPQFGILKYLRMVEDIDHESIFFHYLACANNTRAFTDQKNFPYGKGVATTVKRAKQKAVGEAIERYCSAIYDKNQFPFVTAKEAPFTVFPLDKLVSYEKNYYQGKKRLKKLTETDRLHWVSTRELQSNQVVYVPASLVHLPYDSKSDEIKITQNISTGLASHTSYYEAAVSAICEVIERDAFMIFWRNKLSPRRIKFSTLTRSLQYIIEDFNSRRLKVSLFDMTTDVGIPVVFGILRSENKLPLLAATAACNVSLSKAIQSTLEELELVRYNLLLLHETDYYQQVKSLEKTQVRDQRDHMIYWQNEENQHEISFIEHTNLNIDYQQIPSFDSESSNKKLDYLSERLNNCKLECYLADITTEDVNRLGYYVIRALIPQAHPLSFGYLNDSFECQRLHEVPIKLGYTLTKKKTYYQVPHPFP